MKHLKYGVRLLWSIGFFAIAFFLFSAISTSSGSKLSLGVEKAKAHYTGSQYYNNSVSPYNYYGNNNYRPGSYYSNYYNTRPTESRTVRVAILGDSFNPPAVSVRPGTTVIWTNYDNEDHTVTSLAGSAGSFDSGRIRPGHQYTKTFYTGGTYNYYCTLHPNMRGSVTVSGNVVSGAYDYRPSNNYSNYYGYPYSGSMNYGSNYVAGAYSYSPYYSNYYNSNGYYGNYQYPYSNYYSSSNNGYSSQYPNASYSYDYDYYDYSTTYNYNNV